MDDEFFDKLEAYKGSLNHSASAAVIGLIDVFLEDMTAKGIGRVVREREEAAAKAEAEAKEAAAKAKAGKKQQPEKPDGSGSQTQ